MLDRFISSRSRGGVVATAVALKNSSLVRSLKLHEPPLLAVLAAEREEGKAAREDRDKFISPAVSAAAKARVSIQAVRLFFEGVYQLGPGGFDRLPQATQAMVLDNARTAPLLFLSTPPPPVTCDMPEDAQHPDACHARREIARLQQAD